MKIKMLNLEAILECVCYLLFSFTLFRITYSGEYLSFVTPKMKPYLYFVALLVLLWSISAVFRISKPRYKKKILHCIIIMIPTLLLILPRTPLTANSVNNAYSNRMFGENKVSNGNAKKKQTIDRNEEDNNQSQYIASEEELGDNFEDDINSLEDSSSEINASEEDYEEVNLKGLDTKKKNIIVSDDTFYMWLEELYSNTSKYEGYQIQIKGFVYKDSEVMKKGEFALARMLMSCCVADLVPCGPVCTYSKANELKKDSWIIVTGILHEGEFAGEKEPQIEIKSVKKAEKPKEEYIYPNY